MTCYCSLKEGEVNHDTTNNDDIRVPQQNLTYNSILIHQSIPHQLIIMFQSFPPILHGHGQCQFHRWILALTDLRTQGCRVLGGHNNAT